MDFFSLDAIPSEQAWWTIKAPMKRYGYGIVDKNGNVYRADACVCEDKEPMVETCEALNDYDDPRAPYRVVELLMR